MPTADKKEEENGKSFCMRCLLEGVSGFESLCWGMESMWMYSWGRGRRKQVSCLRWSPRCWKMFVTGGSSVSDLVWSSVTAVKMRGAPLHQSVPAASVLLAFGYWAAEVKSVFELMCSPVTWLRNQIGDRRHLHPQWSVRDTDLYWWCFDSDVLYCSCMKLLFTPKFTFCHQLLILMSFWPFILVWNPKEIF